jgi:hypothetical protein
LLTLKPKPHSVHQDNSCSPALSQQQLDEFWQWSCFAYFGDERVQSKPGTHTREGCGAELAQGLFGGDELVKGCMGCVLTREITLALGRLGRLVFRFPLLALPALPL